MSDEEEYFDMDKQKLAIEWVNEKWKNKNCECCSSNEWTIAEDLVTPMLFRNRMMFVGTMYPQIMVICRNCGNTKYVNALTFKVILSEGGGID